MNVRRRLYRLLFATGLIAAAVAPAADVSAADDGPSGTAVFHGDKLSISVRAGFSRLDVSSFSGGWVPFRISVTNDGPPISGKLVVKCPLSDGPNSSFREYVKAVQIPTGADHYHEIPAYLNENLDVQVRLLSGDEVIAETSVRVDRANWSSLEVAVLDGDPATLNSINQTLINRSPNRPPFGKRAPGSQAEPPAVTQSQRGRAPGFGTPPQNLTVRPTVIAADDLPRDFISYDRIDALVLGDAPLSQLNPDQAHALRTWVASGGFLIVTGAADFVGMKAAGLEGLLPVEVRGTTSNTSVLTELDGVYGAFENRSPALMMGASVRSRARTLMGGDQETIIAERDYGSGLVRFVAINPKLDPYRGWVGEKELWADLLLPAAEARPRNWNWVTMGRRNNSNSSQWGVQGLLYKLAEIAPPSPVYILLFLVAYVLCVGPISYFVLRWKRRTDLAWVSIPAVVIGFTIFSFAIAQRSRGSTSILADVSLVELHQQDRLAKVTSGLLLVPAGKGMQEVKFEGRDSFANDVVQGTQSSSASAAATLEGERGSRDFSLRVSMTTWASALFQARSVVGDAPPLIQVEPTGSNGGSAPSVAVTNTGKFAITKAVYINSDGVSEPFDLGAGEQLSVQLNTPQPEVFSLWYASKLDQGKDEAALFQELESVLDRESGGDAILRSGFFGRQPLEEASKQLTRPIVVCFVENNPSAITLSGNFKRSSKALYVIQL
jgi:hypothetical protein